MGVSQVTITIRNPSRARSHLGRAFFFDTNAMKNQDEKRGTPDTVSCRAERQLRHELNGQI